MIQTRHNSKLQWLAAIACILMATLSTVTQAKITFPVYRLIQMQTGEGQLVGSQSVALNYPSAYYTANISKKVAVASSEDLLERPELLEHVKQRGSVGLLMVFNRHSSAEVRLLEDQFEMQLTQEAIKFPVYYAFKDETTTNVNEYLSELKKSAVETSDLPQVPQTGFRRLFSAGEEFLLSVNRLQSAIINFFNVDVFYGIVGQASADKPIIAVSASYDALSSAPELSTSMSNSASQAIAVIAMSKQFAAIADDLKATSFVYDVAFFLTPTGSLNYQGTTKFIEYMPSSIKDRIEFVVCLDSLAHQLGDEHSSLFVKINPMQQQSAEKKFLKKLAEASLIKGVNIDISQSKIPSDFSVNGDFIQHEHVVYAEKGLNAITVTANNKNYKSNFLKYSIRDQTLDLVNLKRNTLIVSEALLHTIYDFGDRKVNYFVSQNLAEETSISDDYLNQLAQLMKDNARAPHLIQRDSDFSVTLMKLLQANVPSVKRMGIKISDPLFFEEKQAQDAAVASVHVNSTKLMELYVFFGTFFYLFLISVVVKALSGGLIEKDEDENSKKDN